MNPFAPLEDVVHSLGVLFEKHEQPPVPDVGVETLFTDVVIQKAEHLTRLRDEALAVLNRTFAEARELSKKVPDVPFEDLAPLIAQIRDTILPFQEAERAWRQYEPAVYRLGNELTERSRNFADGEEHLSNRFEGLGKLFHYRRIRRLAEDRKKLSVAYRRTRDAPAAPRQDILYYGNLHNALAVELSHRLRREYTRQWQEAAPKIELSEDVLDKLYDAYTDHFLMRGIERERKGHFASTPPSDDVIALLDDADMRAKAHTILKAEFRYPSSHIDFEELEKLPQVFCDVLVHARSNAPRTAWGGVDRFTELVNTINTSPAYTPERRALGESHDRIMQTLSGFTERAAPASYSSDTISDAYRTFHYALERLDLQAWKTLKENPAIRKQYGDVFEAFHQLSSATIWDQLLRVNSGNEKQELRKLVLDFATLRHTPYIIYEAWRSATIHDGDRDDVKTNPIHQYITGLSDAELKEIEGMNIPGVMDIIRVMRTAAADYRVETVSGKPQLKNPRNAVIKRGLVDMTAHYLTQGTKEEAYFALCYTPFLPWRDGMDERLFAAIAQRLGLDDAVVQAFKRDPNAFNRRMLWSVRKHASVYNVDTAFEEVKHDLTALARYQIGVDKILATARHPKALWAEHRSIYHHLVENTESVSSDVISALAHLERMDEDDIQSRLRSQFGEYYNRILQKYRTPFTNNKVAAAFGTFAHFIAETAAIVEAVKDKPALYKLLQNEQDLILSVASHQSVLDESFSREIKAGLDYLTVLQDEKTAEHIQKQRTRLALIQIAGVLHDVPSDIAVPYLRRFVARTDDESGMVNTASGVARALSFWGAQSYHQESTALGRYLRGDPKHFDVIDALCELNNTYGVSQAPDASVADERFFDNLVSNLTLLKKTGFQPTYFLVKELHTADDKHEKIKEWKATLDTFAAGTFDPANELHRNLEYSRFRKIVDHEKVKRHVKNHFTFDEYLTIFEKRPVDEPFSERDQFEIGCVAYEAQLLSDFIARVNASAREQERPVWVVPNLSYGYLPVSPLVEECTAQGIESIIGIKVGSSESHENREVLNSRLFKGYRKRMMDEQPVIIVTDGTQHLLARDDEHKSARYPDAHQGYLNQVIALNDAAGFSDIDYTVVGKTDDDVARLRNTEEFKRLVGVYQGVASDHPRKPYSFQFWNTASLELAVRGNRETKATVPATDPATIDGPAIIFCNIGVLDEQIPEDVVRPAETKHTPAYFDDSGKIISFDFSYDRYGVRYLNRLETAVREAYAQRRNQPPSVAVPEESIPALLRFLERPRMDVEER